MQSTKDQKNVRSAGVTRIRREREGNVEPNRDNPTGERPFWVTRAMADDLGRKEVLQATLCESLIYGLFVIIVTIYTFGSYRSSRYYLTKALRQQFVERDIEYPTGPIEFDQIKTARIFYHYMETKFVPSIYWEPTYAEDTNKKHDTGAMNILYENKVLGVPRMRQVRVKNHSCKIHKKLSKLFSDCYAYFSSSAEETSNINNHTSSMFTYQDATMTNSPPYWGRVSSYGGGGYTVTFNQKSAWGSQHTIRVLRDNDWIRRPTRAVFVDFSIYNANIDMFAVCKLVFEFPPTGGVLPNTHFSAFSFLRHESLFSFDGFLKICEYVIYIFIVFYAFAVLRELAYFKLRFFGLFWGYIEISIVTCTIITAVLSFKRMADVTDALNSIKGNPLKYGNLEHIGYLQSLQNDIFAIDLLFIYVKIFKYLNFNRSMGQLNSTLQKCAGDILCFSVMFFIVFLAFAEVGYILFGSQVENYSSFGIAMFTLLRTVLGDFDYHEIEAANRIVGPIYFLSYIFLVFFVLLNMFLAIINDSYADVKTEMTIARDEMQMTDYLRNLFGHLRRGDTKPRKREENVTLEEIREALQRCQFNDVEIEMFFARYNIDPLAEVGKRDMDTLLDELEDMLGSEANKDMHGYVDLRDFAAQQERLDQIDSIVNLMVSQVDSLLSQLHRLDVKKR